MTQPVFRGLRSWLTEVQPELRWERLFTGAHECLLKEV
jgi:hypothetical protein